MEVIIATSSLVSSSRKGAKYELQQIKNAARGLWASVHLHLCGISNEFIQTKHGPCPKHGGKDKWRVFDDYAETGGAICNDCQGMADGLEVVRRFTGCSLPEAIDRIGDYLGLQPKETQSKPKNDTPTDPAKHLELNGPNDAMATVWCAIHKKGIKPEALWAFGAQFATYRKRYPVFAIPIRGQQNETVGWCLYHATGKTLPIFTKGSKEPVEWRKIKITSGSKPGWIGPIAKPTDKIVWKTEGPSCLLSLLSLGLPEEHSVCCNAFGAEENPATTPWMLDRFRDIKEVFVVHDCDKSGQRGATEVTNENGTSRPGWAPAIANYAKQVRNYVLPWPMVDSHGQDLRDLIIQRLAEGLTDGEIYQHILSSARLAPIVEPIAINIKGTLSTEVATKSIATFDSPPDRFWADDPHRLARSNLENYRNTHQRSLRYFKEIWYRYEQGCYSEISNDHLSSRLTGAIEKEFERVWHLEIEQYNRWLKSDAFDESKDKGPPKQRKTKTTLVNDVVNATKGLCILSASQSMHDWIHSEQSEDGVCVAVQNGILNISKAIQESPPDKSAILLKHTPSWFSTSKLLFPFDENASCPNWRQFLGDVFNNDTESIETLQKWFGYLLTPDNSLQKILFVIGKKRSGKGTIVQIMKSLFGQANIATPKLIDFSRDFGLQSLTNKSVGIIADARLPKRADDIAVMEALLSISGGDPQDIPRKFKDTLSGYQLPTRFTIFSNEVPNLKDFSEAFVSRCIFLSMPNTYLGREDLGLLDRLRSELPGILNWAIVGRHFLNKSKHLVQPATGAVLAESLKSPVLRFCEELIDFTKHEEDFVDTKELFHGWQNWVEKNELDCLGTSQSLARKLKGIKPDLATHSYRISTTQTGLRYLGMKFREEEK